MLLRSHHYFTGHDLDIWVDEKVAQVCDSYLELLSEFPTAVKNFAQHQPLFWDEKVRPPVRKLQVQQIPSGEKPYILITDKNADLNQYIISQEL